MGIQKAGLQVSLDHQLNLIRQWMSSAPSRCWGKRILYYKQTNISQWNTLCSLLIWLKIMLWRCFMGTERKDGSIWDLRCAINNSEDYCWWRSLSPVNFSPRKNYLDRPDMDSFHMDYTSSPEWLGEPSDYTEVSDATIVFLLYLKVWRCFVNSWVVHHLRPTFPPETWSCFWLPVLMCSIKNRLPSDVWYTLGCLIQSCMYLLLYQGWGLLRR